MRIVRRALGCALNRALIAALAVCLAAASAMVVRSQDPDATWPSRIVDLPETAVQDKAPVVTTLCLQPEGPLLATAGDDHLVRIWDTQSGELLYRLSEHADWVRALAFSPDGRLLASGGNDRQILLWDPYRGEKDRVVAELPQAIAGLAFSPDGKLLAAVGFDETLRLYETGTWKLAKKLECPSGDVRAVAFSPDGTILAAGGRSGVVRTWSSQSWKVLRDVPAHERRVRGLAFSPDGSLLASCGEDGVVRFVRVTGDAAPTGAEVARTGGETEEVTADAAVVQLSARPVKLLAIAPCGAGLWATGGSDNAIRLWDIATRKLVGQLQGHTGSVVALDCRDGVLVSGSYDTTVRVWNVDDATSKPRTAADAENTEETPVRVGEAAARTSARGR